MQAKPVVDALQQDAAGLRLAIDDQHALGPCRTGGERRLQTGRPAADHEDIVARLQVPRVRGDHGTTSSIWPAGK